MDMNVLYGWAAAAVAWAVANPEWSVGVAVYILANVIPRRPPTHPSLFALWSLVERLMFLGWDRWGGKLHRLGLVYPEPELPEGKEGGGNGSAEGR